MVTSAIENQRLTLARRPEALPSAEHFALETLPVPALADGEVLVEVQMAALSPWQNQRLKDFKNYTKPFAIGELIDCDVLGRVIESRAQTLEVGQQVTGRLGWQTHAVTSPDALIVADAEFDPEQWLTVLSSPGLTASIRSRSLIAVPDGASFLLTWWVS